LQFDTRAVVVEAMITTSSLLVVLLVPILTAMHIPEESPAKGITKLIEITI
jgi:hypothetical protein